MDRNRFYLVDGELLQQVLQLLRQLSKLDPRFKTLCAILINEIKMLPETETYDDLDDVLNAIQDDIANMDPDADIDRMLQQLYNDQPDEAIDLQTMLNIAGLTLPKRNI